MLNAELLSEVAKYFVFYECTVFDTKVGKGHRFKIAPNAICFSELPIVMDLTDSYGEVYFSSRSKGKHLVTRVEYSPRNISQNEDALNSLLEQLYDVASKLGRIYL